MGRGKMFHKGRVYKLKIHQVELNWFEKMVYGITGRYQEILKVKVCRIHEDGVGPCINYLHQEFYHDDWKMEPNWLEQSKNRAK